MPKRLSGRMAVVGIVVSLLLPAFSFPVADPAEQGISADALEALAGTVRSYCNRDLIVGGTLLVIKNRHVVLAEAEGWHDRETGTPMRVDTLFNIRSMTKMLTGAACQILIDEGVVGLDDRVAEYLPGFDTTASRGITVEQLLTHRSGLPLSILTSLDDYPTLYAMANAIGQRGPQFTPGSQFWYSDAGSDSLGALVEVASGMPLDVFMRARLLEPLGMTDTYYLHETATPRSRIGSLYYGKPGTWTRIWTGEQPFYPYAWGSQSLYSTAIDYARFLAMLLDGGMANGERVLSEAAVVRILTPVSVMSSLGSTVPHPSGFPGIQTHYGQMSVLYPSEAGLEAFGHSGSDGTWACACPEHDLMVLYFTQSRGQSTGIRLETELDHWLLRPAAQPSAETVARYAPYLGWYEADFESTLGVYRGEEFSVVLFNGRLGLDIPGHFIFQLRDSTPTGRWYFEIESELSVTFNHDGTGAVTGIRFYEPGKVFQLPRIRRYPEVQPILGETEWLPPSPDGSSGPVFKCWLQGTPDYRYVMDYSNDLTNWIPLQTNVLGGSRLEVIDHGVAEVGQRVYRARVLSF